LGETFDRLTVLFCKLLDQMIQEWRDVLASLDSFRILIVDDELPQLELIGGFLKKQGFDVVAAEGGEKALQIFRQESFELSRGNLAVAWHCSRPSHWPGAVTIKEST